MIDERIAIAFATSPAHSHRRLIAAALASAAYFGLFALLMPSLEGAVAGLSIVPVGVAAWLYGMRAGIVAGLVGFPLQVLGFALVLDDGWTLGLVAKVAPGTIGVGLAGAAIGRLRDLQLRLQTQATLHDRANAALLLESEITSHMAEGVFLTRTMLAGFGEMMATAGEAPRDVDLAASKPVTVSTLRDALSEVVGL